MLLWIEKVLGGIKDSGTAENSLCKGVQKGKPVRGSKLWGEKKINQEMWVHCPFWGGLAGSQNQIHKMCSGPRCLPAPRAAWTSLWACTRAGSLHAALQPLCSCCGWAPGALVRAPGADPVNGGTAATWVKVEPSPPSTCMGWGRGPPRPGMSPAGSLIAEGGLWLYFQDVLAAAGGSGLCSLSTKPLALLLLGSSGALSPWQSSWKLPDLPLAGGGTWNSTEPWVNLADL